MLTGEQDKHLRILFVDQITFSSLLRVWALGRSLQTIWFFEPIAPSAKRLLRAFRRLGLIRAEARQIDHHIGQVRNEDGGTELHKFHEHARSICSRIKRERFANNPLIKAMGSTWATSKVLLYFDKMVEGEVRTECLRIGLVEWLLRTQMQVDPAESVLVIEKIEWFPYLEEFAQSKGIRLVAWVDPLHLGSFASAAERILRIAKQAMHSIARRVWDGLGQRLTANPVESSRRGFHQERQAATPRIAIRYGHRKVSFDPAERSEFFWLDGSGIPFSEVLLYDYCSDEGIDDELKAQISARGVSIFGRGPGIPSWHPTGRMYSVFLRCVFTLCLRSLICGFRGHWPGLYCLLGMMHLAIHFAHWHDFYSKNRVILSVDTLNANVGQALALDALNGLSVSYQYSASNIISPTFLLSAGEDVQFVFSSVFEQLWSSIGAPVHNFAHTGYIYDRAIKTVQHSERVDETRKRLQRRGAEFILCFFDENSVNRWDIPFPDRGAARDYEYLLEWLLSDPALGLVFKPKVSASLFRRIESVSQLIGAAMDTGRCTFLTSETLVGGQYPAEAASMADVCVGKLIGGTAALEARLAGIPTVLIDGYGLHSHPARYRPQNPIVYDEWDSLRAAVERYRAAPEEFPGFGDWSPWLSELDPFQDGQASLRMGSFIRRAHEILKTGESKMTALATAAEEFAQVWGRAHITVESELARARGPHGD